MPNQPLSSDTTPRILIVDHDEVMVIGVAELLRKRGFVVQTANRLDIAVARSDYDLVIFDPLVEPGLTTAKELVANLIPFGPSPSLIMVSEFIHDLGLVGAPEGDWAAFHPKPIRVAALAELVEAMLRRSPVVARSEGEK